MSRQRHIRFPGWGGPPILVILLLLSFVASYITQTFVIIENVRDVFGLLGLLPFVATGFLAHLISSASPVSKSGSALGAAERRRISHTIKGCRNIYLLVATLNILLGSVLVFWFIFIGVDHVFVFLLALAIYFAMLSIVSCVFEERYLSSTRQHIQNRLDSRARRKKRLDELRGARSNQMARSL